MQQQHFPAAGRSGGQRVERPRRGVNLELFDHPPDSRAEYRQSVLVIVPVVGGVAVALVQVVHMVAVLDRVVAAVRAVLVRVVGVFGMPGRLALVVVALVFTMQMAFVGIVDMVSVLDRRVTAVRAVLVVVAGVLYVCCGHQTFPLSLLRQLDT